MLHPKFLIADDSEAKQFLLEGFLKRSHWNVKILKATSTDEAKRIVDQHPDIAFAFVDYEMPSENGPAVIAYLKKVNPSARIALVSASDADRYESEAYQAGAEAFICTTREERDVLHAVSTLLQQWSAKEK